MKLSEELTDNTILSETGKRLTKRRLELGMTQAELAYKAGISKRTLERLESGASTQLSSFIRILRSLDLLHRIDTIPPKTKSSPMELLRNKGKERQRASSGNKQQKSKEKWSWGDE